MSLANKPTMPPQIILTIMIEIKANGLVSGPCKCPVKIGDNMALKIIAPSA
jgi:hypothetical protein